ncbi:Alpha-enolase, partial [Camelus dromedarius]
FGKYDLDLKSPDEPGGYIFPDQEEALKSSLRDWERLSKTAFEQDDWEAWMKFIAGAAWWWGYALVWSKQVHFDNQNWVEDSQLLRTGGAGSKAWCAGKKFRNPLAK